MSPCAGAQPEARKASGAAQGRGGSSGAPVDEAGAGIQGQLALATVALLWGSYSPTLRWLYTLDQPPTPVALTAARTVIQAAVLYASAMAQPPPPQVRLACFDLDSQLQPQKVSLSLFVSQGTVRV
jgi:hypothetical protein